MRLSVSLLLIAGALLSLGAGLAALQYIRALESELAAARTNLESIEETVEVPALLRDVPRGTALTAGDVGRLRITAGPLPENVLRELELPSADGDGDGDGDAAPVLALRNLAAGSLLLATDLGSAPEEAELPFPLSAGSRAFAFSPRNLDAFAGSLPVGGTVDLFWTRAADTDTPGETRLLGTALRILALPGPAQEGGAAQVIVEGRADEVALWLHARESGGLSIAPANGPRDPDAAEIAVGDAVLAGLPLVVREGASGAGGTAGADAADTRGGPLDFLTQIGGPAQPAICALVVVRSAQRSVVEVPC